MYGSDEVMERLYDIMIKDKKSQVDIIYNQLNGQLSEANIEKNLPDLENKTEEDVEKMQPSISYKNYLDEIYRTLI